MNGLTIFEFDTLVSAESGHMASEGVHTVPPNVFAWLQSQSLRDSCDTPWLRLSRRRGHFAVQVTSFVGVIRAPNGFQIEVLPKVGRAMNGGANEARRLLIDMLCCLQGFRHVQTDSAKLSAHRMPLLEVFLSEFLRTVERVVKRGLRSEYNTQQNNLPFLRGKLLTSPHLRKNLFRADRFFTEHDELSQNRPENRLLHAALRRALSLTISQANQQLTRELCFVFADVPISSDPGRDFQRVRLDRGMDYYADALSWARLILEDQAPLTGVGHHTAPSLLFPMEAVFEAFVAKHLAKQLLPSLHLKSQTRHRHFVRHQTERWFRLQPDLLVARGNRDLLVLDTKWKLLDSAKADRRQKYGLSQSDFYQLHAYGQNYLNGCGDVVLIFPKSDSFKEPLPQFEFIDTNTLRLWVLPFCLESKRLLVPAEAPFAGMLSEALTRSEGVLEFGNHLDCEAIIAAL